MKNKYLFTWKIYGGESSDDYTGAKVLDLSDKELEKYVKKNGWLAKFQIKFICRINKN